MHSQNLLPGIYVLARGVSSLECPLAESINSDINTKECHIMPGHIHICHLRDYLYI